MRLQDANSARDSDLCRYAPLTDADSEARRQAIAAHVLTLATAAATIPAPATPPAPPTDQPPRADVLAVPGTVLTP
jgi:hypothetical protein